MKAFKRLAALLIAAMMVLSTVAPAMAEEVYETNVSGEKDENDNTVLIQVNGNSHVNYKAVQIFKGTQYVGTHGTVGNSAQATASGDNNPLGDIQWGENLSEQNKKDIIDAVREIFGTNDTRDASKYADYTNLAKALTYASTAQQVAEAMATSLQRDLQTGEIEDTGIAAWDDTRAKDLAQVLGLKLKDVAGPIIHANTIAEENKVDKGYYLLIDQTQLGDNDALNASILQMTKDIVITKKTDATYVVKKILQSGDKVDANSATVDDIVTYEIESEIPDTTYYDYYYFVINDDLSAGLTPNFDSIEVFAGNEKLSKIDNNTSAEAKKKGYYLYTKDTNPNAGGHTFQVAFENVKEGFADGTKIYVRYTATLNDSAVIGSSGNPNEVDLTYSHQPDNSGRGEHEGPKPGVPAEQDNIPTRETVKDIVITYTSKLELEKVGEVASGEKLEGAGFTLTGVSKITVLANKEDYFEVDNPETFDGQKYYKLKDGTYSPDAPIEEHMDEAAPGATEGYVVVSAGDDLTNVTTKVVNGVNYRPYVAPEGTEGQDGYKPYDAGKQIYVLVNSNENLYDAASLDKVYEKKTVSENTSKDVPVSFYEETDKNGQLSFDRLGEGIYKLEETKVPDGYNKADVIYIKVEASIDGKELKVVTITNKDTKADWSGHAYTDEGCTTPAVSGNPDLIKGDTKAAVLQTTVIDAVGSTLPETGGIGTTLFYAGGAILVLLAGILLVSKRRIA